MEKLNVKVNLDDVMKNEPKHNGSFKLSPHVDVDRLVPEKKEEKKVEPVEKKTDVQVGKMIWIFD